jgi:hypothetical protein
VGESMAAYLVFGSVGFLLGRVFEIMMQHIKAQKEKKRQAEIAELRKRIERRVNQYEVRAATDLVLKAFIDELAKDGALARS